MESTLPIASLPPAIYNTFFKNEMLPVDTKKCRELTTTHGNHKKPQKLKQHVPRVESSMTGTIFLFKAEFLWYLEFN